MPSKVLIPGLLAVVVMVALIPALAGAPDRERRVGPGVRFMGRDLARLSQDEVPAVVEATYAAFAKEPFRFHARGVELSISADMAARLNTEATALRAMEVGKNDNVVDYFLEFIGRSPERAIAPVVSIDEPLVAALVEKLAAKLDRPAQDAALVVSPAGVSIAPAQPGWKVERAASARRLREHLAAAERGDVEADSVEVRPAIVEADWREAADLARHITSAPLTLRFEDRSWLIGVVELAALLGGQPPIGSSRTGTLRWDEDGLAAFLARVANELEQKAKDAKVERGDGKFIISGGVEGRKVDLPATIKALKEAAAGSHEASAVLVTVPPSVVAADWEQAVDMANFSLRSPPKLTFADKSWNVPAPELAAMLTFTRTQAGAAQFAVSLDADKLDQYLRKVAKEVDRPAKEPRVKLAGGKASIKVDGQDGLEMDVPATAVVFARQVFAEQRAVAIAVSVTKPSLSASDVAKTSFPDLIMDAATSYAGSIPERAHNVELASALLDGTVVPPGGVFSFNRASGPTTLAAGFQIGYGITIRDNQAVTVPSEGGGICQVATTIFHAAFNAGLPIVERQEHIYWIPRYGTPPRGLTGLDATVEYPYLDFKFRNATSDWLLVESSTDGQNLRFALRGKKPGWEVKIDPPVITGIVKASQATVRQEDPTMPVGYELWVEHAEDGFSSRIRRVVSKDGKVIETTDVVSRYRPAQNVLLVGTKPPAPTPTPKN